MSRVVISLASPVPEIQSFIALSGDRSPCQGKLGVVEEGALADLLLVNGDPLANIRLLEDSEHNLLVIMKDGKIFKNLAARR